MIALQLTAAAQTFNRQRYVMSRHVIARRSLTARLLLVWITTLIVAMSPFVWFYLLSGGPSTAQLADSQSKFRKLVLCVFVLSFAMPAVGILIAYLLLLRTWITASHVDR